MQPNLETVFEHAHGVSFSLEDGFSHMPPVLWAAIVLVVCALAIAGRSRIIDRGLCIVAVPVVLVLFSFISAFQLHAQRYEQWMDRQVKPFIASLPREELALTGLERNGDRYTARFRNEYGEQETITGPHSCR